MIFNVFSLILNKMATNYFENAGEQLYQAVFMLAQGSRYPDPIMCSAILALPSLIERLKVAQMNPWVRRAFDQFISTAGSEATSANIVGSASEIVALHLTPCGEEDINDAELIARFDEAERLLPLPSFSQTHDQKRFLKL